MGVQLTRLTRRRLVASALTGGIVVVANPRPSLGQDATPVEGAGTTGIFAEMLALAPDVLARPERPQQIAQVGDVAAQLAALGLEPMQAGGTLAYNWVGVTQWILLPDDVRIGSDFRELFGFDLFQVDQGLIAGEPPEPITYLRGRFVETELTSAWTKAGYQELDEGGATVFSLSEEAEFDADNPIHQMVAARFNNATIFADGTVVFAPSLDLMREALVVASGQAPSLAANEQIAAILSTVDQQLASAILLDGAALSLDALFSDSPLSPEAIAQLQEQLDQSGEMPPPRLALFGITPGGPILPSDAPEATPTALETPAVWVIRLLMDSQEAAETAVETISNRIATLNSPVLDRPYADLMTVQRAEALSDPPAVVLDLDIAAGDVNPSIWFQSIFRGDLLFLAY